MPFLRYHNGTYYAYFSPNDTPYKGYVYTTSDPKKGFSLRKGFLRKSLSERRQKKRFADFRKEIEQGEIKLKTKI